MIVYESGLNRVKLKLPSTFATVVNSLELSLWSLTMGRMADLCPRGKKILPCIVSLPKVPVVFTPLILCACKVLKDDKMMASVIATHTDE